jgi:preprotein translocase subunit SecD
MQGNGIRIAIVLFFILVSGYKLWPSLQHYLETRKLTGMETEERESYELENFSRLRDAKENALKLGLDLLGGMHVTLEVRVDALVRDLATDTDDVFDDVLRTAREEAETAGTPLIDAFVAEFEARDADARLSRYFRNPDQGITRRSTNLEVAQYLRSEANDAVSRAIEIIRDRVDRYGVTEPSIQRQGTRRVIVELPGIDDPERVRGLLKGTARLEFRLMAEPNQVQQSMTSIIEFYEEDVSEPDSLTEEESLADSDTTFDVSTLLAEDEGSGNRLLDVMQPVGQGVIYGLVSESDTAEVNQLFRDPSVAAMVPSGISLMYTASPVGLGDDGQELFYILGVHSDIEMTGEVIEDARVDFDQMTNAPQVTMVMNSQGARTWARLTGANVGKNIAIVLDNVVYSWPVVNERIVGGRSQISGLDSQEEAQDIVTVLKSGALPAPVEIVEERTVGPSLGRASIRAGFTSVSVGLMLVALFMILYYRTGGFVADLALLINILFILGILAGFQATLTLPGIAGIVLTIGMAVDANVLIFERIREEDASGKTRAGAIKEGYGKALSAIFDANITTLFVAAILYSFGVGPIQGFAVTLFWGILASMFSAIIFTRIIFDYLVLERKTIVSYG